MMTARRIRAPLKARLLKADRQLPEIRPRRTEGTRGRRTALRLQVSRKVAVLLRKAAALPRTEEPLREALLRRRAIRLPAVRQQGRKAAALQRIAAQMAAARPVRVHPSHQTAAVRAAGYPMAALLRRPGIISVLRMRNQAKHMFIPTKVRRPSTARIITISMSRTGNPM